MLVMARGVGQGRAAALFTVLGMTVGAGMVQLPLVIFGVTSLIKASPPAFAALQWMGAAYLVWLGLRLIFTAHDPNSPAGHGHDQATCGRSRGDDQESGPWPITFMVAFLPQFVDPHRGSVMLPAVGVRRNSENDGRARAGKLCLASGSIGSWIMARPRVRLWQQRIAGFCIVGLETTNGLWWRIRPLNKRTRKEPRWGSTCVHRQECDRDAIPANGS